MGALLKLPAKESHFSLTKWLNSHAGADVDKMMNGDLSEQKKSEKHFAKKTLVARSKFNGDQERK